ncbi:MAG: AAA family ATPase [Latescibacteria bacterium DG_63]|uniref:AAA family ATPase n=1 Tax=candidate division TA06 bacterium SM23_40 TaxID=1703774 RepID=A0A0S8G9C2_UNCT6|nr:MAG: AAA family ATPase [Latescibacteria bacterium DG_63]KPK69671.1 MAG: AAA family ATPase [candidate division TA06 bacterium SM23_40]
MIERILAKKLKEAARQFPVATVTGPRQSGKTTLVQAVFKDYDYLSLELPDQRQFALEDPRGFLSQVDGPVILDEVQRAPDLFSYIQVLVDEHRDWTGRFILTGSQNFLLLQNISQSLAGRCAVLHLLPFSLAEIEGRKPISLETLGKTVPRNLKQPKAGLMDTVFTGFYPRIHDKHLSPRDWLASYYQTYLERDVRNVLNVGNIEAFGRFVRLCAGRCGQLLNLSGLATDCGISHTTAKRWLSVLEASFIITLLRPHHRNFGKRLTKSPKLYFLDTGLLCYLLQVQSPEELYHRAERGAIFESFVVSELYKNFSHRGEQPPLYFWRDAAGHEVNVIIEMGSKLIPVETKSAQTVASDFFDNLTYWRKVSGDETTRATLIYGGDRSFKRSGVLVYSWLTL